MPLRFHVAIATFVFAIMGGMTFAFLHGPNRGELFDKPGWSVLQGMNDPPDGSSSVVLRRVDGFDVLGFRGIGVAKQRSVDGPESHWSWLLLNEHQADGEIKQMPEFRSYELPCSDLRQVERALRQPDVYAVKYLRSICT